MAASGKAAESIAANPEAILTGIIRFVGFVCGV